MILLKILGLATLICAGIITLIYVIKGFTWAIGGAYVYKPLKQYSYKVKELVDVPEHWKCWEKNV